MDWSDWIAVIALVVSSLAVWRTWKVSKVNLADEKRRTEIAVIDLIAWGAHTFPGHILFKNTGATSALHVLVGVESELFNGTLQLDSPIEPAGDPTPLRLPVDQYMNSPDFPPSFTARVTFHFKTPAGTPRTYVEERVAICLDTHEGNP